MNIIEIAERNNRMERRREDFSPIYVIQALKSRFFIESVFAVKDIPKIHLKCRERVEVSFPIIHHAEDLYIDDDILEDTPPIPLPDSPYWQCVCDFGIGDSKTVYARLNEKHEVDGICVVPESEDIDENIEKNIFSHKNVERVEKEKPE